MVRWMVSSLTLQPRTFEQQDLRILRTKYNVQQAVPWVVTVTMLVRFLRVTVGLSLHQWIDRWRPSWIGWPYARCTRCEEDEFGAWRRDMTWMCTKWSDLWADESSETSRSLLLLQRKKRKKLASKDHTTPHSSFIQRGRFVDWSQVGSESWGWNYAWRSRQYPLPPTLVEHRKGSRNVPHWRSSSSHGKGL